MKQYIGPMAAKRFNPTLPQVLVALDRYADAQKVDNHRVLNQRTFLAGVSDGRAGRCSEGIWLHAIWRNDDRKDGGRAEEFGGGSAVVGEPQMIDVRNYFAYPYAMEEY